MWRRSCIGIARNRTCYNSWSSSPFSTNLPFAEQVGHSGFLDWLEKPKLRNLYLLAGLVNYPVPSGEAHLKALEIAWEINEKEPLKCSVGAAKRLLWILDFELLIYLLIQLKLKLILLSLSSRVSIACCINTIFWQGPTAIRMAKKAINDGREVNTVSSMAVEQDCYGQLLDTKDRLEGLAAFAEKRKRKGTGEISVIVLQLRKPKYSWTQKFALKVFGAFSD